ncbi:MAG: hypothetical protein Tsb0026_21000 [Sulfuricaulis sp.]
MERNAANCRNRRVFTNAGAAATRNHNDALMKHLSAPIRVQGRHWGSLRLAYRFK